MSVLDELKACLLRDRDELYVTWDDAQFAFLKEARSLSSVLDILFTDPHGFDTFIRSVHNDTQVFGARRCPAMLSCS
jgi:hypothetical protein